MIEPSRPCGRCGAATEATNVRGLSMERCTSCGAVTMAEDALEAAFRSLDPEAMPPIPAAPEETAETEELDIQRAQELAFLLPRLDTDDDPTEWSDLEPGTEVMNDITVTSEDSPTSVLASEDLPFHLESQPPPPRRSQGPNTGEFVAPPMLFAEDEDDAGLPPVIERAALGAQLAGEGDFDMAALKEAEAPPTRDMGPGPESDFDEERTRPAYPMSMETTLDPTSEFEPFRLERERKRQTRTYLVVSALALLVIGAVGSQVWLALGDADDDKPTLLVSDAIGFLGLGGKVDVVEEVPGPEVEVEDGIEGASEVVDAEPNVPSPAPTAAAVGTTEASPEPAPAASTTIRVVKTEEGGGTAATAPAPEPQKIVVSVAPSPAPAMGFDELVEQGWSLIDSDPATAQTRFEDALRQRVGHPDASFGLGMVLMRQGRKEGALHHLCVAATRGGTDTRAEVSAILDNNGLSCP